MNVIGHTLLVLKAADPTHIGKSGLVVLETANTLLLQSEGRLTRIAKRGTAFKLDSSAQPLTDTAVAGRLQDRLGRSRS